jgi:hypothetical protein
VILLYSLSSKAFQTKKTFRFSFAAFKEKGEMALTKGNAELASFFKI